MDKPLQEELRSNRRLWWTAVAFVPFGIAMTVREFLNAPLPRNPWWYYHEIVYMVPVLNMIVIGLLAWDFARIQRKIRAQDEAATIPGTRVPR